MPVDISATFTKKERPRNGLEAIAKELDADPMRRRVVVGIVECIRTQIDHTNGDARTPVVKFVHIEPMDGDDEQAARELLERASQTRLGGSQSTLFDPDDEADEDEDDEG